MGRLDVDLEFLQRALGFGEQDNPLTVGIFPEALPDDFPLALPDLPGVRIIGGVRSIAPRWSFNGGPSSPEQRMWRVFLDAATDLPTTMQVSQAALRSAGWEAARPFMQTFVEQRQTNWIAVHPAHSRQLNLNLRQEGELTQIWLQVTEIDRSTSQHLLDQHRHFDQYVAPLPSLTLPAGWRAQMKQVSGGGVHSEEYLLRGPQGADDLLPFLLPQLEEQGWRLLHHLASITVYQTAEGVGTLLLVNQAEEIKAVIVHATGQEGQGGQRTIASFE